MPSALNTAPKIHATLPFSIMIAGQEDIPALVDIYVSTFNGDFGTTALPETSRALWARDLLTYTSNPIVHLLKAVKEVDGAEVIAAWALWTLREDVASDCDSDDSESEDEWWDGEDESESDDDDEKAPPIKDNWDEASASSGSVGRKPHMYLEVIATSPDDQRRGAESLLLEHVLIEADELGLEVHTEASSLTAPLYRGFGFEDRGCIGLSSKAGLGRLIMGRSPDTRQRLKHGVGQRYY